MSRNNWIYILEQNAVVYGKTVLFQQQVLENECYFFVNTLVSHEIKRSPKGTKTWRTVRVFVFPILVDK